MREKTMKLLTGPVDECQNVRDLLEILCGIRLDLSALPGTPLRHIHTLLDGGPGAASHHAGEQPEQAAHAQLVGGSLDGRHVPVNDGSPEVGVVVAELVAELGVQAVVEEDDLGLAAGGLLDKHVTGVGVTVDVTLAEDHSAVQLADLAADVVHVDVLAVEPGQVVDVPAGAVLHH